MGKSDKHAATMRELEVRHERGDKRAVLDAYFVCTCSIPQKPLPTWAIAAFWSSIASVTFAEARSWDDVFGKPWPKGARLEDRRTRIKYRYQVWAYCRKRHSEGLAIGPSMYEEAARHFGFGRRQIKEMFEEFERDGGYRSNLWGPPRKNRIRSKRS